MTQPAISPRSDVVSVTIPRSVAVATGVAIALLALGICGLTVAQKAFDVVLEKPPAELSKPFSELSRTFGENTRYTAVGPDRTLDKEIVAVLGTEDYLLRNYQDSQKRDGDLGRELSLNLNFYATGSATPHVPEVCWAGNGLNLHSSSFFVIPNVKHKDGTVSDIRARILSFEPKAQPGAMAFLPQTSTTQLINVAYVFNVNGRYVANTREVTKHFWDPTAKYAYHTKIEVTVPALCTPQEAQPIVEEFFRSSLAEIEQCLPDPEAPAAASVSPQEAK